MSEAVYRQQRGEDVELHFTSTSDDDKTLAYTKQQVWKQWDDDTLPDGWTRRRTASTPVRDTPQSKQVIAGLESPNDSDLTSALERLRSLQSR